MNGSSRKSEGENERERENRASEASVASISDWSVVFPPLSGVYYAGLLFAGGHFEFSATSSTLFSPPPPLPPPPLPPSSPSSSSFPSLSPSCLKFCLIKRRAILPLDSSARIRIGVRDFLKERPSMWPSRPPLNQRNKRQNVRSNRSWDGSVRSRMALQRLPKPDRSKDRNQNPNPAAIFMAGDPDSHARADRLIPLDPIGNC